MTEDKNTKSKIAEKEEEVLKFWQENKIFEKSLEQTKDKKPFVFHDGPPFATGTPHYGHLVASVMKDVIPRYQTMKGRFVERQWGWDTHGLPIENIVEKELNTKSKKEIEEIGIGKFNNLCREKIFTYVDVWNKFIPRFGRWVNMDNPYRTMDVTYMESEWWAFKELFDKGLIYKDYRSMHICPRCETTLAQAEVAEGYKDIKDIAVTAKFELEGEPNTFVLAWTTTPWTLPGNVALAVNPDFVYVKIEKKDEETGNVVRFILIKEKLKEIFKEEKFEILDEFVGKNLIGKSYRPIFDDYAKNEKLDHKENGWKIYGASFVTVESGTGVVHIAPAFGEDDMELGKKEKLPFVQHVGMNGIIRPEVKDLAGLSVKPIEDPQKTDVEVLKILAQKNLLFSKEKYEHPYPHCWRCETPLLNYATSSWFVSVSKIKTDIIKYAKNINWQPRHIKDGRWHSWLENARDWSISRQRFWANTIPVWENDSSTISDEAKIEERLVIGSVEELKKYTKKSGNKYFVMRHGQAEQNLNDLINSDPKNIFHLTEEGKRQVKIAAEDIKNKKIDFIICSPLERCKETAEIVRNALNLPEKSVLIDDRVWEEKVSEYFEGKTWTEFRSNFSDSKDRYERRLLGSENFVDVKRRVGEMLYSFEEKYKDKNILIVSHQLTINAMYSVAMGTNIDEAIELKKEGKFLFKEAEFGEIDFVPLPHNENYELDLHRPYIDVVELVNERGTVFKRVTDVLDTWFDSGSVPFSSYHYPFENKEKVESRIPADFIAEGLDQISKWFYYQHVFASSLFGKQVFNNVVVNGIVLAEDGKKMSKRLKNYQDPTVIVDKYGADSLRYYLMSTPVMKAEDLNFSEKGVDDISKKIILKLENILSFYEMYSNKKIEDENYKNPEHVLDNWILARLSELHKEITESLDVYDIFGATRPISGFIDDFSTWYIRRSRDRFKSDDVKDRNNALTTTHFVLLELAKCMAPFTPFFAEQIYLKLKPENGPESVHLCSWPEIGKIDKEILEDMIEVRKTVSLALEKRMTAGIKVRQPLNELKIKNQKLKSKEEYLRLIKDEINVKNISFDEKLENEMELDTKITPELQKEGNVRDIVRVIQELRKNKNLVPNDEIELLVETNESGKEFLNSVLEDIKRPTNVSKINFQENDGEKIEIDNMGFKISLLKAISS